MFTMRLEVVLGTNESVVTEVLGGSQGVVGEPLDRFDAGLTLIECGGVGCTTDGCSHDG